MFSPKVFPHTTGEKYRSFTTRLQTPVKTLGYEHFHFHAGRSVFSTLTRSIYTTRKRRDASATHHDHRLPASAIRSKSEDAKDPNPACTFSAIVPPTSKPPSHRATGPHLRHPSAIHRVQRRRSRRRPPARDERTQHSAGTGHATSTLAAGSSTPSASPTGASSVPASPTGALARARPSPCARPPWAPLGMRGGRGLGSGALLGFSMAWFIGRACSPDRDLMPTEGKAVQKPSSSVPDEGGNQRMRRGRSSATISGQQVRGHSNVHLERARGWLLEKQSEVIRRNQRSSSEALGVRRSIGGFLCPWRWASPPAAHARLSYAATSTAPPTTAPPLSIVGSLAGAEVGW